MTTRPVVLVTGSAAGIGQAAALGLADEGYDVFISYSVSEEAAGRAAEEARARGAQVMIARADVPDEDAVQRMVASVWPPRRHGQTTRTLGEDQQIWAF